MSVESSEQLTYTIDTAVADAMIYGYAPFFDIDRNEGELPKPDEDLSLYTDRMTSSKCAETCARSAYFLWSKYPGLFPRTFLMQSFLISENLGLIKDEDTLFTRSFFRHYVWGAQAIDGRFFFGSPNNAKLDFIRAGNQNPLTTVHEGQNLPEALGKLEVYEGSYWPDEKFIEEIMQQERLLPRLFAIEPHIFTSRSLRLNTEDFATLSPHIPKGKKFLFVPDCVTASIIISQGKPGQICYSLDEVPYHILTSNLGE